MKDNKFIISIVLAVAAICISVAALVICITLRTHDEEGCLEKDAQYVLYLGTNDKDTDEPVCSQEEAKSILKDILLKHMGGYTIQEAEGGWIGDDGTTYQEYTLVIYLTDTTTEKVHALCDELIDRFDQSTVLIRTDNAATEFYGGSSKP